MNYYFLVNRGTRIALPRILSHEPSVGEIGRIASAQGLTADNVLLHAAEEDTVKRRDMLSVKWYLPEDGSGIRPATAAEIDAARPAMERYVSRVKTEAGLRIEAIIPGLEATQLASEVFEFLLKGFLISRVNEHTELTRILALWAWAKSVRVPSATLSRLNLRTPTSARPPGPSGLNPNLSPQKPTNQP
jgi:hypothetical protein